MAAPLALFLIEQEGHLLLGRRKDGRVPFAGQWCLPGDALGPGETAPEAVTRFGRDELAITILGTELLETCQLESDAGQHQTWVYRVGFEGRLRYRSIGPFAEIAWATATDLPEPMPPALHPLLNRLLQTKAKF